MDIQIRPFKSGDAEALFEAVRGSVAHLSLWLPWCTPSYSLQDAKYWVETAAEAWRSATDYRFVIEEPQSQAILGGVGINQIIAMHRIGNLGYWVRQSALNQGVCTGAARQVLNYAFSELKFQRIEIHAHPDNTASNAVALKLGAVYEGTLRNKLLIHGKAEPAKCYSIIPEDLFG